VRDLIGAKAVLAELKTLTIAQLSAIDECHRINMRRQRQRSIFGWKWQSGVAVLVSALVSLVGAAEKVGGVKSSDLLPLIKGVNLTGVDLQSSIIRGVIFFLVTVLIFFVMNFIIALPIQRRVRAFDDILTIAKAYRKGPSETAKLSGEQSLTATG